MLTDHVADFLFTTEKSAHENLHREGVPAERVHFVGNVMIDTLLAHRERARSFAAPARHGVKRGQYVLLTLHRPNNVDDPEMFEQLMGAISEIACDVPSSFRSIRGHDPQFCAPHVRLRSCRSRGSDSSSHSAITSSSG